MQKILNLYKEQGETPLERIERFRAQSPEYRDIPLSYAGRLDPMAEGVLLVVVGEENKQKEKYLSLEKEYIAEILFGFSTDTFDTLGVLSDAFTRASYRTVPFSLLEEYMHQMIGEQTQEYPPFSSKPLDGTPLFIKARKGEIAGKDFILPLHTIHIFDMGIIGSRRITSEDLQEHILRTIGKVRGDFRQERICSLWEENLRLLYGLSFDLITVRIRASSGTYVRGIAHTLGQKIGIPALAFSILRRKVGRWSVKSSER
jgi:tRNA pseudouridine(55) synthase